MPSHVINSSQKISCIIPVRKFQFMLPFRPKLWCVVVDENISLQIRQMYELTGWLGNPRPACDLMCHKGRPDGLSLQFALQHRRL